MADIKTLNNSPSTQLAGELPKHPLIEDGYSDASLNAVETISAVRQCLSALTYINLEDASSEDNASLGYWRMLRACESALAYCEDIETGVLEAKGVSRETD